MEQRQTFVVAEQSNASKGCRRASPGSQIDDKGGGDYARTQRSTVGAPSLSRQLMHEACVTVSLSVSLADQGISTAAAIKANLGTAALVEEAIRKGEGRLTRDGALLVDTGKFTGRSVKDKFVVRDATSEDTINWGAINQPMSGEHWATLKADFLAALEHHEQLYVADLFGGSRKGRRRSFLLEERR
jgi:hypothetical protein